MPGAPLIPVSAARASTRVSMLSYARFLLTRPRPPLISERPSRGLETKGRHADGDPEDRAERDRP